MDKQVFVDLVEKHFDFLIRDYGFSIIYARYYADTFGNCYTVLESGDCRIRVGRERGVVEIHAGSKHAPYKEFLYDENWYDLYKVTRFLTQGTNQADWDYRFPESGDLDSDTENQMVRLVKMLKPHWSQIIDLFQEDAFKQKQKDLDDFIHKLAKKQWGEDYK